MKQFWPLSGKHSGDGSKWREGVSDASPAWINGYIKTFPTWDTLPSLLSSGSERSIWNTIPSGEACSCKYKWYSPVISRSFVFEGVVLNCIETAAGLHYFFPPSALLNCTTLCLNKYQLTVLHPLCFLHTQASLYWKTNFGVIEMKGSPTKLSNAKGTEDIADGRHSHLWRTRGSISFQFCHKKNQLLESNWRIWSSKKPDL